MVGFGLPGLPFLMVSEAFKDFAGLHPASYTPTRTRL
jgi:hypothetical protein